MKKRLNDLFSVTRNERIALICFILIIAAILTYKAFSPTDKIENITRFPIEQNFQTAIDTVKIDTLPKKKKKRKRKITTKTTINTAASMKKTDTF